MTQEFEVTAEELVRVLQRRGLPLPSEIGAFVVLEACEKLSGRPTRLTTRDIFITEHGDVECGGRTLESDAVAASALLGVLAELLVCAAPGVPAMLLDLVEHGPNERGLTLGLLRSDLEACLLPLNRAATRRVLSRLVREVRKAAGASARPGTTPVPGEETGDVDATFDDLLGDSIPPPQAASQARAAASAREEHPAERELPAARSQGARTGAQAWDRDARERALHEAVAGAGDAQQTGVDRAGPTPVPRAGARAARRRASEGAEVASAREPARARRDQAPAVELEREQTVSARRARRPMPDRAPEDSAPEESAQEREQQAWRARGELGLEAEPARRAESLRAARDSAFRGYSSQAPADSEQPDQPASRQGHAPGSTADEPLPRAGRAAEGGEGRRRHETDDGDAVASLRERSTSRRRADSDIDERARSRDAAAAEGGERRRGQDDVGLGRSRSAGAAEGGERRRELDDRDSLRGRAAADERRRGNVAGSSAAPSGGPGGKERRRAYVADSGRPDARASARSDVARSVRPKSSRAPLDADSMLEAQATRGRVGLWIFIASTAAAVALLLGYFALGREQAQSALGFLKPSQPAERAPVQAPAAPRREYGDLRVSSKPPRAQVLLLIGPGPALATDIPVGVAQEFIAIADNYRPARALLPADATWDELDGQARYELAIQARPLGEANKGRPTDGLGATLLPQEVGTPKGRLGSVRVVTTPRAAHVYQLIGFTPDVHVDNLPLDHPYEVLVYLEGKGSQQKHIEPSDFQVQNGKRVASVDVTLSP